jgi:hypothetical protein
LQISFPLTTYLSAADAAIDLLQKLRENNMFDELAGFLSVRFTASTSAKVSMSYSANKEPLGRSYLEVFSLYNFFRSIQGYENLLGPLSEQSVNTYQVCVFLSLPFLFGFVEANTILCFSGSPSLGPVYYAQVYNPAV